MCESINVRKAATECFQIYIYTHTFDTIHQLLLYTKRETKKRQSPTLSEKEKPREIQYAKKEIPSLIIGLASYFTGEEK
jgi:hypothetical protein